MAQQQQPQQIIMGYFTQLAPQHPYYNYYPNGRCYQFLPQYGELFQNTFLAINRLKEYARAKWTQQQKQAYMKCLIEIQQYIKNNVCTGIVYDYNVYNEQLVMYGTYTNPIGYQLYTKQLEYMYQKEGGKIVKDTTQNVKKQYQIKQVEEKQIIRKDDPIFDIQQLKSRNWNDPNFVTKQMVWKQNANLVFIGHVDSGKSTLTGNILKELKQVDQQQLLKNKQQAKETHMEQWQLAFIADIDPNERRRGKTIQCSKLMITLPNRRFTLFDAPGHKNYVPNMIMGACQADIAVLLVSAKEGQFQSGFQKEGQTKEHAMLAKALGVQGFIVVVSKMGTVNWDEKRFRLIKQQVEPFLGASCGFHNVTFIPIDSLQNVNIHKRAGFPWYNGPCLIEILENIKIPIRAINGPLRIPIVDKFKDLGSLYVYGKIESGIIEEGQTVSLLPKRDYMNIKQIYNARDQRMPFALAGENVKIRVKGIQEQDINRGDVICSNMNFCQQSNQFKADLTVLQLPQAKKLLSSGYQCVLHMHAIAEQIQIAGIQAKIDPVTKKLSAATFLKAGQCGKVLIKLQNTICLEKVEFMQGLGRFTLRDEGKTIGYGQVTKIKPAKNLTKQQKDQALGKEQKNQTKTISSEGKDISQLKQGINSLNINQS